MEWIGFLFLGAIGLAITLFVVRFFCTSRKLRKAFLVIPGLLLAGAGLSFVAACNPWLVAPILPYESLGQYNTTDAEGSPWDVDVSFKYLSYSIPPGMLPRIKLVAHSSKRQATITTDTGWRFGVGDARAIPGGLEVFSGGHGMRFHLKAGIWKVGRTDIDRSTSLWEDRLEGLLHVGMSRDAVLQLVRAHRTEELPDLWVWLEGEYFTQHSLDRDAALYATYSAAGVAVRIELRPRMLGTIDELRDEIDPDLFPLVALIHDAPKLLGADPIALVRAVNGLRAAGRDRAAAALREYHRLTDPNAPKKTPFYDGKFELEDDRLFCIIRLLFVSIEGGEPLPPIDMPWVRKPPPGDTGYPLYPVVLENGFPFVVWTRQLGGGSAQNPMVHLDFCLAHALFRDSDLEPRGSPLKAMDTLLDSQRWARLFLDADFDQQRYFLQSQVIATLGSVLPYPEGKRREEFWWKWMEDVAQLKPRWDSVHQCFVSDRD